MQSSQLTKESPTNQSQSTVDVNANILDELIKTLTSLNTRLRNKEGDRFDLDIATAQQLGLQHICQTFERKLPDISTILSFYEILKSRESFNFMRTSFKLERRSIFSLTSTPKVDETSCKEDLQSEVWIKVSFILRKAVQLNIAKLKDEEQNQMLTLAQSSKLLTDVIPKELATDADSAIAHFLNWDGKPREFVNKGYKNN